MSPTVEHLKPSFPNINGYLPNQKPITVSIMLDEDTAEPQQNPIKPVITLDSILGSHLALYFLAMRYQIPELAHITLLKIFEVCESHPPCAETLVGFVRGVYYDAEETGMSAGLTRGTPLRDFVAKYSAFRLDEVKTSDGFKKLLAQGGEFVVDLMQCVMGGKRGVWLN